MSDFLHEKTMLALNKELGFDNNVFLSSDDSEYSNAIGKKARERRSVRRDLRSQGVSRKEARKEAMIQVGRGKLGKGVLKVSLAPVRGAFLSLLLLNFRGFATKIMAIERNQPELKRQLKSKWENQFGGSYDELIKAAQKAENKKPFFCGKQCKLKVVEQTKSSFDGGINSVGVEGTIYDDFFNSTGVDIAVLVGLAGTVVATIGETVNQAQVNKGKKMEIQAAERMAEKELATLTANQKAQIEAAERRLQAEADPKKAILNNPDLSVEEKKSAIELLEKTETSESSRSINRVLMIGIPVLLVVGLGFYFVTRKK